MITLFPGCVIYDDPPPEEVCDAIRTLVAYLDEHSLDPNIGYPLWDRLQYSMLPPDLKKKWDKAYRPVRRRKKVKEQLPIKSRDELKAMVKCEPDRAGEE